MRIVSVLRTGPEYGVAQAKFLHDQLQDYDSVCFTDLPSIPGVQTIPLSDQTWPGWWAKMELFNPSNELGGEDLFYIDLDTIIVGDLGPVLHAMRKARDLVMVRDFYHPQYVASSIMYIPAKVKARIFKYWTSNCSWFMTRRNRTGRLGDQGVIAEAAAPILTFDDLVPGAIVSYKKHCIGPENRYWVNGVSVGNGSVPEDARIMCFHGKPRPWLL